jgi:surfeit locus 1 family protein
VDRGWIPADGNGSPESWIHYEEAAQAEVQGVMRLGVTKAPFGGHADPALAPGQTRLDFWNFVILDRLAAQILYPILPVYIQPNPNPANTEPPILPTQPEIEITEGPHMGYAIQWFFFASILLIGYPFFLRKQESV